MDGPYDQDHVIPPCIENIRNLKENELLDIDREYAKNEIYLRIRCKFAIIFIVLHH